MMKKISFYTIAIALVAVAGWNVMQSSNDAVLSDMALANVEALADECDTYVDSGEKKWDRYYRADGTGYNCSPTGDCTC
jgi:hypothetical protein